MKILAVVGDYWHKEEMIKDCLDAVLESNDLTYVKYDELRDALSERPDAVILYKENRLNPMDENPAMWMNEEIMETIVTYVKEGGGFLAWHSGMAEYPIDSQYIDMLRGAFLHHPSQMQTIAYKKLGGDLSEIAFQFIDEHYFVTCKTDETNVFLTSESIDGTSIAGWEHSFGNGRVCCLAPAHTALGLMNETFQELLREKITWCARKND